MTNHQRKLLKTEGACFSCHYFDKHGVCHTFATSQKETDECECWEPSEEFDEALLEDSDD